MQSTVLTLHMTDARIPLEHGTYTLAIATARNGAAYGLLIDCFIDVERLQLTDLWRRHGLTEPDEENDIVVSTGIQLFSHSRGLVRLFAGLHPGGEIFGLGVAQVVQMNLQAVNDGNALGLIGKKEYDARLKMLMGRPN